MFCFFRYRKTLPPRLFPEEKPPRWETTLFMRFIDDPLLTNGYRDKSILPIMERWVAAELNGSVSGRSSPSKAANEGRPSCRQLERIFLGVPACCGNWRRSAVSYSRMLHSSFGGLSGRPQVGNAHRHPAKELSGSLQVT